MFKKVTVALAILILALSTVFATTYEQKQSSFKVSAYAETNFVTNDVGAEVEYQFFPWQNNGFVLGTRAFEYFSISPDKGIGKLHPMVMPYLAYKYKNFEIGGGAGFNLNSESQPDITPYARMNWDIFFNKDSESSSKFGMSIGTNWYFDALLLEEAELTGLGGAFAGIGLAIVEVIVNAIPKM
ncbi:MAG: hypothetical protein KBS81_07705, partial [Spirochaetales bacterium]|nr:hypothetical protein [Candidatus Physcosoma equi]